MARFEKGHKFAKGRPVGSKNKRTNLLSICEENGINLFEEQLLAAMDEADKDKRFSKFSELMPYVYARKKETLNLSELSPEELLNAAEEQLEPAKEA